MIGASTVLCYSFCMIGGNFKYSFLYFLYSDIFGNVCVFGIALLSFLL